MEEITDVTQDSGHHELHTCGSKNKNSIFIDFLTYFCPNTKQMTPFVSGLEAFSISRLPLIEGLKLVVKYLFFMCLSVADTTA